MTTNAPEAPPPDPRLVRELLGLLLLTVGALAVVVAAWQLSPWLVLAFAGAASIGAGAALTMDRA